MPRSRERGVFISSSLAGCGKSFYRSEMVVFLFIFSFMGAFAGALAYFTALLLFPEAEIRQFRRARTASLLTTLLLPPILFLIFLLTSPPGAPVEGILIPSAWVLCMLVGISVGLAAAVRTATRRSAQRPPQRAAHDAR